MGDDLFPARMRASTPSMFVQVYQQVTLPTSNDKFYACHPVTIGGVETEGGTPTFAVDTSITHYVDVVGTKAPSIGDTLIAHREKYRWVAERGQGSGGLVGGCCPSVPATLAWFGWGGQMGNDVLTIGESTYPGTSIPQIHATFVYQNMPASFSAGVIIGSSGHLKWVMPSQGWLAGPFSIYQGFGQTYAYGGIYYLFLYVQSCTITIVPIAIPNDSSFNPLPPFASLFISTTSAMGGPGGLPAGNTCSPFSITAWDYIDGISHTPIVGWSLTGSGSGVTLVGQSAGVPTVVFF